MEKRGFKGIWIPKEVWLNEGLTVMEKLFLVEIDSLDNEKGCFASNKHFANFFGLSKGRCTQIIKGLEKKNLIKISYEREGKSITKRIIKVVSKLNTPYNKLNKGSSTSENNKDSEKQKPSSDASDNIPYKKVVDYLNEKTGSKYRSSTKVTKRLIRARWNEGFELDDFKKVIDVKVSDWSNDAKMVEYLRPQTLFGTKFESYLNQPMVESTDGSGGEYDDLF